MAHIPDIFEDGTTRRLPRSSPHYPASLRALGSAPDLFLRGAPLPSEAGERPRELPVAAPGPPVEPTSASGSAHVPAVVAIVGTRKASEDAQLFARRLARDLAHAGVVVVSGGAMGIDRAAHLGALDVGGSTWLVSAAGLDRAIPATHRRLFAFLLAGGGTLVSEGEDGTPAHPGRFLARNRIIAGLAQAVVVVEAPLRSGARSTAAHARRLGRPVLAVPYCPWQLRGAGCNEELRLGARVCTGAADVLAAVGIGRARGREAVLDESSMSFSAEAKAVRPKRRETAGIRKRKRPPRELNDSSNPAPGAPGQPKQPMSAAVSAAEAPLAGAIEEMLRTSPRTLDELIEGTGATAGEVMAVVSLLEMEGLLARGADERYRGA